MKKVLSVLMMLVLLVGTLGLTACSAEHDEALMGTWEWEDMDSIFITFNSNGTGSRNWHGDQTFNWSTSGSNLNIDLDESPGAGYIRNERWTFSVSGDTVTFDSRQTDDRWVYVRR